MTKEEFINQYCKDSKITTEELLKYSVVLPCNCDYDACQGWAVIRNDERLIKFHNELYSKI